MKTRTILIVLGVLAAAGAAFWWYKRSQRTATTVPGEAPAPGTVPDVAVSPAGVGSPYGGDGSKATATRTRI